MPDSGLAPDRKRHWSEFAGRLGLAGQAAVLLLLSALFFLVLEYMGLPAGLLLGPMAAAILIAVGGGSVRVPEKPFLLAQSLVGCFIASNITRDILGALVGDWPVFVFAVVSVIAASSLLGWLLTRSQILPGTSAIWGSSPGAATTMTFMAEAYGADVRLVAFMQYIRVVFVAIAASAVSRIWAVSTNGAADQTVWFPPIDWLPLVETLGFVVVAAILGRVSRIPAGAILVPLFGGAVLQTTGVLTFELPPWLLALSYALVGWNIGLRFTRAIVIHAAKALPRVIGSILALIAICGIFAAILVKMTGVDALTAYLAMSPGGADSVAIIAASSKVNLPFIMALQTARLLIVILTGPPIARFIAARMGATRTAS
jgi:membrane AbrB-like protein